MAENLSVSVVHLIRRGYCLYLRPYWREQILLLLSILPSAALTLVLPLCLATLMDRAIPRHDYLLLSQTLSFLGFMLLLATLSETLEAFLRAGFGFELRIDLRQRLFSKLQQLPLSFHDQREPGEIAGLFARELLAVRDAYRDLVVQGGKAAIQITLCLAAMFWLNWQGALAMLLLLPWIIRNQRVSLDQAQQADYQEKLRDAKVVSVVQDQMTALPLVRAFGLSQWAVQDFSERVLGRPAYRRTVNRYDWAWVRRIMSGPEYLRMSMTVNSFQNFAFILALLAGAGLAYRGFLTIGQYSALMTLIYNLGQAVGQLSAFLQGTLAAASGLQRLEEVLELPVSAPSQELAGRLQGGIKLQDVSFSYQSRPVVQRFTLEIQPRTMVALVGRSGGGKSTVIRLILGLYCPEAGQVFLDGVEVRNLSPVALRGQVGVVLQDLCILNLSILDNLRLAKPDATLEEIYEATQDTEIHDFIMHLPQQYETVVGEGGKLLSPGQRQRLALARAILCKPGLLLLDEVTSALDPDTERSIHGTLRRLAMRRTVVLVTHRLSLAVQADEVVVVEKGQVAQKGKHEVLLESPGPYRQQWQAQSGFTISPNGRHAEVSRQRLQSIPLFEDLSDDILDRLAQRFLSDHFEAGEDICREGQQGERFYLIVRGRARVLVMGSDGEEMHVATLEDGDYFGEDALLDSSPYATGVQAELACLVLALQRADFLKLLGESNRVLESLQDTAVGRSLTLFGRRGRRPSSVPAYWEPLVELPQSTLSGA